jgi:probable rRNA maturation factor
MVQFIGTDEHSDTNISLLGEILTALYFPESDRAYTIAVHFVTPEEIQALNSTHRQIEEATDVLSFPTAPSLEHLQKSALPEVLVGDIIICLAMAEADQLSLLAHGCLHLLGFDHELDGVEWNHHEQQLMDALAARGITVTGIAKGYL